MSGDTQPRLVTTIERAVDVLGFFASADKGDLGVTEIATELGLSKAVVHRVLTTLAAQEFVTLDPRSRRYRLGPMVLALSRAYTKHLDLRSMAAPVLRSLSEFTDETATLSLRYGRERVYVDQVTPDREVKMTVSLGRAFPLHAGSSSKAFLAFLSKSEREHYLDDGALVALTERTITDPEALQREIELIRERGFAVSTGERQEGAASIAAPVLDISGNPIAVVSVCGPVERFGPLVDSVASRLLSETASLSRAFGFNPGEDDSPNMNLPGLA